MGRPLTSLTGTSIVGRISGQSWRRFFKMEYAAPQHLPLAPFMSDKEPVWKAWLRNIVFSITRSRTPQLAVRRKRFLISKRYHVGYEQIPAIWLSRVGRYRRKAVSDFAVPKDAFHSGVISAGTPRTVIGEKDGYRRYLLFCYLLFAICYLPHPGI